MESSIQGVKALSASDRKIAEDLREGFDSGSEKKPQGTSTHAIQSDSAVEGLRLINPKFAQRGARLDLISNRLQNFSTKLGSNSYALCDISAWGFSYAQKVVIPAGYNYAMMKRNLTKKVAPLIGKKLPFEIFSTRAKENQAQTVNGSIRNFRFFLGLPILEVEKKIKQFLYRKGYSTVKDPRGLYAKGMLLVEQAKAIESLGQWDDHCEVSLSMSMVQFLEELGAPDQFFDDLWLTYNNRPLFTKFGVFVEEGIEAEGMLKATGLKEKLTCPKPQIAPPKSSRTVAPSAKILSGVKVASSPALDESLLYNKANRLYRSGPLLAASWKALLHLYHLDENTPFPKSESLKPKLDAEMILPLEQIFDTSGKAIKLNLNKVMTLELTRLIGEQSKMQPPSLASLMRRVLQVKGRIFSQVLDKIKSKSL